MDKRTVLAFVLIALVFFGWSYFFAPKPPEQAQVPADTSKNIGRMPTPQPVDTPRVPTLASHHAHLGAGENRYVTVETPLYRATLNSRGGTLARF